MKHHFVQEGQMKAVQYEHCSGITCPFNSSTMVQLLCMFDTSHYAISPFSTNITQLE